MKLHHLLLVAACGAALMACQPPAPETTEAPPVAEAPAPEAPAIPANCAALASRNWDAELGAGASPTLTISGEIDLPTPGYSVSLARDPAEGAGASETRLTLNIAPPSGIVAQVITPTPVHYFAPANGPYATVHIACGDGDLATIELPPAP